MRAADQTPSEKHQDSKTSTGQLVLGGTTVLLPIWLAVYREPKVYNGLLAAGLVTAAVVFILAVGVLLWNSGGRKIQA